MKQYHFLRPRRTRYSWTTQHRLLTILIVFILFALIMLVLFFLFPLNAR